MSKFEDALELIDGVLEDEEMAKVAWVVIRQWADRGADLTRAANKIANDYQFGGRQFQVDETMAQLEDIRGGH